MTEITLNTKDRKFWNEQMGGREGEQAVKYFSRKFRVVRLTMEQWRQVVAQASSC